MLKFSSHRGFSILMALGVTAVLMIVVTGLAAMYARELKLSRLSYDEVLVQATAEGMFEYGMLKAKNHEAGFADEVKSSLPDLDTTMFKLSSDRSKWLEMDYKIDSQTGSYIGKIPENGFLTIPLFVDQWQILSNNSRLPKFSDVKQIQDLRVENIPATALANLSWTISAMNGNENVTLQGTGAIDKGYVELKTNYCSYVEEWQEISDTQKGEDVCKSHIFQDIIKETPDSEGRREYAGKKYFAEELMYTYQLENISVNEFLDETKTKLGTGKQETELERKMPYLTIFNPGNAIENVKFESSQNFSLPTYTITSTAKKGDASQVFALSQDKGSEMELLKYGYYGNTTP